MKYRKLFKRVAAILLCITLFMPANIAQAALFLMGEETLPREEIELLQETETSVDVQELEETLLHPDEIESSTPETMAEQSNEWDGETAIYWNPGGDVNITYPEWLASPSIATKANATGQISKGSDHANGLTPYTAVENLNTAIRRAEKMSRQLDIEISDITIYAMNPMIVPQGSTYTIRGKGVTVVPWGERSYDDELIFVVEGGQLSLSNITIQPEDGAAVPEEVSLLHISSGTVQLGEQVEVYGTFVLNYSQFENNWEWASISQANASDSQSDRYQEPVIELTKKFDMASEYLLDLRVPYDREHDVTAVRALYADQQSAEEFLEAFTILASMEEWELLVEERIGGVLRDTTEEEELADRDDSFASESEAEKRSGLNGLAYHEDVLLTQKSLIARHMTRSGRTIFWNPGPALQKGNVTYPAGQDTDVDGTKPIAAFKTFGKALEAAEGGRIICMQTIDLINDASDYLSVDGAGNYIVDGLVSTRVTLSAWSEIPQPMIKIPAGKTLILKNLNIVGLLNDGETISEQTIICDGGQLILEGNVMMPELDPGLIQVNLDGINHAEDYPIIVNDSNVFARLYYNGINDNLDWMYQDVVIAGSRLLASAGSEHAAGDILLQNIKLSSMNIILTEDGGVSKFPWELRKDTIEDDLVEKPSHLELYTIYYYDAIFLDGIRGADISLGASCTVPVRTFAKAKSQLDKEMQKSLAARQIAYDQGKDWQSIPMPKKLYICDTVSISDAQTWDFPLYTDIDGTPITIEILSHRESSINATTKQPVHQPTDVMVHLDGAAAELTLSEHIRIRNTINKKDKGTYTIVVTNGATLTLKADADLSGLQDPADVNSQALGTHILVGKDPVTGVISSGNLNMTADWSGAIHSRQYGIYAYGTASSINMKAGAIKNHKNLYTSNNNNQYTAGIYLNGASLQMTGGEISENASNLGGAGVYLEAGAVFDMTKGVIQKNKSLYYQIDSTIRIATINLHTLGTGVFVGNGATFNMGTSGGNHDDCLITEHVIDAKFKGVGVYVDLGGTYNLYSGTVSKNYGSAPQNNNNGHWNYSRGAGIACYGDFYLEDAVITENRIGELGYGGGIFLEPTAAEIKKATITYNMAGYYSNPMGGGIYIENTGVNMTIENVLFEQNRGLYGGGLTIAQRNGVARPANTMIIKNCIFNENFASNNNTPGTTPTSLQRGGGMHAAATANLTLKAKDLVFTGNLAYLGGGIFTDALTAEFDNVLLQDNTANYRGGGAYIDSNAKFFGGLIKGNTAVSEHGGGICQGNGSVSLMNTEIIENTAGLWSGGYCHLGGNNYQYGTVIKGNKSTYGAGYSGHSGGTHYFTDVKIIDNEATEHGGGYGGWSGTTIFNETVPGTAQISGNKSKLGGGLIFNSGTFYLDIAGPIQNEATIEGHNLYVQGNTNTFLMQGELLQPAGATSGIYNVYARSETALPINIDPQKISIPGSDQVYVDSPNVQIKYLKNPLVTAPPDFSVSLNQERFKAGNIVIRPYGNTSNLNLNLVKIKSDISASENYTTTYPPMLNAATDEGVGYAKGGLLPPRTVLAGENDPDYPTRRNIVLLGKGIYLDGTLEIDNNTGIDPDNNTGVDPDHAVKTFKRAKELLEEYTDEANADPLDTEGFPPFIYICGTVTIDGTNPVETDIWDVDRTESRYTTDSKYRAVEEAEGRTPEDLQVRRYSAFIKTPMIKVTSNQTLTISDLTIDGLMQSVDKSKQGQNSRIIDVTDATLVLKDRANIRNNYWNMIRINNGNLQIQSSTPDSEQFRNQQLELTSGIGVELENNSVMTMDGYASILFVEKMFTNDDNNVDYDNTNALAGRGVIARTGSSLTMNDHSKIEFVHDTYKPNQSGATGVVLGTRSDTGDMCKIQMNDQSSIRNCLNGIALSEYKADIVLTDHSELVDNYNGIRSRSNKVRDGLSIVLKEYASIYDSQTIPGYRSNVGIYLHEGVSTSGKLVNIELFNDASIYNANHGIYIQRYNSNVKITMDNNSTIHDSKNGYGISMDNGSNDAEFELTMKDHSSIYNTSNVAVRSYQSKGLVTITMQGDSSIHDITEKAIYVDDFQRAPARVYLKNDVVIYKATNGVYLNNFRNIINSEESLVSLSNQSRITSSGTAVVAYNFSEPVRIAMTDHAAIVDSSIGIGLYYPQGLLSRAQITMQDDTWLGASQTGVMSHGIYFINSSIDRVNDRTGWYQINLSGNALIGGDGPHNEGTAKRGLKDKGIYVVQMPFDLTMTDSARINYSVNQSIFMTDENNPRMLGKINIRMKDQTEINNSSHRGIEMQSQRDMEVILADQAAIKNTVYGNYITGRDNIVKDIEVKLLDQAYLMTPSSTNVDHHTLQLAGGLTMDGTATVEKTIYMMNGNKPITLSKPIPFGDPTDKYLLKLAEGYVGQIVVKPDGTNVTDATVYDSYFKKIKGDGVAESKNLVNQGVNIVLQGENNVYLSGVGNDSNNGISPSTPVRTFKRAKELLETGYFTAGANIIICHPTLTGYQNVPVVIQAGDEDWSFDGNGAVTNQNSHETWKPVVTGNHNFWGILLKVDASVAGAASEVRFADITIDSFALKGGSKSSNAENKEILRVAKGTAIMKKGSVFKNSHSNHGGWNNQQQTVQGVRIDATGTFIMDGGTITDITSARINPQGNNSAIGYGLVIWNQGIFEMRSGSIENCSSYMNNPGSLAIIANTNNGKMVMSGGSIHNNTITVNTDQNFYVAGVISFTNTSQGDFSGGIIEDNKGVGGSAIFVNSTGKVELSGGKIRNNNSTRAGTSPVKLYSPIYVANTGFTIKGGGAVIEDAIYLDSKKHLITLSGNIYHTFRRYYVYLNETSGADLFTRGDAVIQPDNASVLNTTGMLINFIVCSSDYILDRGQSTTRSVGTIDGVKEDKCLILMKAVYLDSATGTNNEDGSSPEKAVATFTKAKDVGQGTDKSSPVKDYFVIYMSGPAYPLNGETWSLEGSSYMCRYTGFEIYDRTTGLEKEGFSYHGYLIEVQQSFSLANIKIYGRRAIDSQSETNGESILHVLASGQAKMLSGTVLARNLNEGGYIDKNSNLVTLSMKGGAASVDPGGLFDVSGGRIIDAYDSYKTAIYQAAEQVDGSTSFGHVILKQDAIIEGGIYLSGKMNQAHAYLEAEGTYIPKTQLGGTGRLTIVLENDYNGREVVKYVDGVVPTNVQIDYYKMEDSLNAIYSLINRTGDTTMLELSQRQALYIDGQSGSDGNAGDSPAAALQSFDGLYSKLQGMSYSGGVVVFVVDRIDIKSYEHITLVNKRTEINGQIEYEGEYTKKDSNGVVMNNIDGNVQIFLKRYSRPTATSVSGFDKQSYKGELIRVNHGGKLILNGIYLDGHAENNSSNIDYLTAPGVEAEAPLVVVQPGGYLEAGYSLTQTITSGGGGTPQVGLSTATLFANNYNNRAPKGNSIGLGSNGQPVLEASSAGIEILSDHADIGEALVKKTEFSNLRLGTQLTGGSDIYQNGKLTVQEETILSGSVFLEGRGSVTDRSTSRTLNIGAYGTPVTYKFHTLIRDQYNTREVCIYPSSNPNGPGYTDLAYFLLEESVTDYFTLNKRPFPQGYIIELQVPEPIYVDGQNGDDTLHTGLTPSSPVRTLEKAYKLLAENRGQIIYIVDTVVINETIELSPKAYVAGTEQVALFEAIDHVEIRRYVKPKAAQNNSDYDVPTFEGTLFKIAGGYTLTLQDRMVIDGHFSPKAESHYPDTMFVSNPTKVKGVLFDVAFDGKLQINQGTELIGNHNNEPLTGTETRPPGGAVWNKGTVVLNGGKIADNDADHGAGIYQDGVFQILDNPPIIGGQEIYLTAVNSGTVSDPVWEQERMIETAIWIDDADGMQLDLNMDGAVPGRPVIKYMVHNQVDPQYVYYELGSTVPNHLFLVENPLDDSLLELQDWRILDISVPEEIFLIIRQNSQSLIGAYNGATDQQLLESPEYKIKNNGRYDTKIILSGFINDNAGAGITAYDPMTLVQNAVDAIGKTDLYLAVKSSDSSDPFGALAETSLYDFGIDGVRTEEMGLLQAGQEGTFEFIGVASRSFISKYDDPAFPFFGSSVTAETRMEHIRNKHLVTGVTSTNHARAKYKMTYRVFIDPIRR